MYRAHTVYALYRGPGCCSRLVCIERNNKDCVLSESTRRKTGKLFASRTVVGSLFQMANYYEYSVDCFIGRAAISRQLSV